MAPRIVFHVGLAKTGTTFVQNQCHRHQRQLAKVGVLYPRACRMLAKNHSPLASSYLAHRPRNPTIALWQPIRAKAVAAMRAELDASPCAVALVSSEHFSIHFDTHEARMLAEDFRAYDAKIVISIREPFGRFLSTWNTHVTAGGMLTLDELAPTQLVPDNRLFSIREIVKIWQAAFGFERVRLVDYDGVADILAAILRECGAEIDLPPGPRSRVSLPFEAIATLRAVNAAIAARQTVSRGSYAAWLQHTAFSLLAQRRLASRQGFATTPTVSAQTMAALDMIYDNDNAFLSETFGHALASTRARYQIGEPKVSADDARKAEALLREVSRGLWGPSEALVAVFGRPIFSRLREHVTRRSRPG